MMCIYSLKDILQITSDFATTVGIFFALGAWVLAYKTYRAERKQEIIDKEYRTFDELDDKYIEFMYSCSQYPHLDLFSVPLSSERHISENDMVVERALFSVLISIFERVVLMYKPHPCQEIYEFQYKGWEQCMRSYCTRKSFLRELEAIGSQFDVYFQGEMKKLIEDEHKKAGQA